MIILRHRFIKSLLAIGVCMGLSYSLNAAPSKLESNSPFLPPGYSSAKPEVKKPVRQTSTPINRDLEFRGIIQLDGAYQFSLFKKSENRGYWITEGGSENGISISNFNPDSMRVVVSMNGQSQELDLINASESPLPVVASSARNSNTRPGPPLPADIQALTNTNQQSATPTRRTIPRRRVIVPPKR